MEVTAVTGPPKNPLEFCACGTRFFGVYRQRGLCCKCYNTLHPKPPKPKEPKPKKEKDIQKQREYVMKYYYKNRDKMIQKARERYYKAKTQPSGSELQNLELQPTD